jgi:DNA-binding beta-propeller fold protein YncE
VRVSVVGGVYACACVWCWRGDAPDNALAYISGVAKARGQTLNPSNYPWTDTVHPGNPKYIVLFT